MNTARDPLPVPDRHPTCDVGREGGALVAADDPVPNDFTGEVRWVEIDVGAAADDADHVLGAGELLRVAMARQ